MTIPVLYEDDDLLIINKPAGVVVNRSETTTSGTIQDWLEEQYHISTAWQTGGEWQSLVPAQFKPEFGTPEEIFAERLGMVHRLDRETSGALVLAKNPGSLVNLLQQFKQRKVTKQYTALVHGKFPIPEATLSFPIGRASHSRVQFAVKADGREAVTYYKVLQFFSSFQIEKLIGYIKQQFADAQAQSQAKTNWLDHPLMPYLSKLDKPASLAKIFSVYQGFSLIECWPKTGRTHQIRVHMKHLHHPLVGDEVYVGKARKKLDSIWCHRHFLHASQLKLAHPRTGQQLEVTAALPPDLEAVLDLLQP